MRTKPDAASPARRPVPVAAEPRRQRRRNKACSPNAHARQQERRRLEERRQRRDRSGIAARSAAVRSGRGPTRRPASPPPPAAPPTRRPGNRCRSAGRARSMPSAARGEPRGHRAGGDDQQHQPVTRGRAPAPAIAPRRAGTPMPQARGVDGGERIGTLRWPWPPHHNAAFTLHKGVNAVRPHGTAGPLPAPRRHG